MASELNKKALELLSERPLEPVFTARDNGKAIFDIPDSYYADEYTDVREDIQDRYSGDVDVKIPLRDLSNKPNLNFTKPLGMRQQLSLFQNQHQDIAGQLIETFMSPSNLDSFIATCAYCKDRVNPFLFQYCYAVAVQHRTDTKNFPLKPIAELFPANFVEPAVLKEARKEGELVRNPGDRRHIQIPQNYTASDREEEQRLGYFREDIGVNSHHWHWHLVYPGQGPHEVVAKDRRGELFYYMHHQIIARYNVERLCNNLPKIKLLNNLRAPISEGYFPKLLSSLNNRTYPARVTNYTLKDIDRGGSRTEVADIERYIDRVIQAIDQGYATDMSGKNYPLDEVKGIDILGDIIECSALSVNRRFYGSIHNEGHNAISFAHDPDNRFLEDIGVMGDVTTAMRDPIFYRWHGYLDTIFNRHKMRLPPYGQQELGFDGIIMQKLSVIITKKNANANTLLTFWEKSDVELGAALDFGPNGNIFASFTHLQHAPFEYKVQVNNTTGGMRKGTMRIFLCPKTDERGTNLTLEEQRLLAIELDKKTVMMNPGVNNIVQASNGSSVTIPYERSFRSVGRENQPTQQEELAMFRFCGCGWPEHMLLPKGKPEGMPFDLFVMISDFTGDAVEQKNGNPDVCGDSSSFCGLKDKLYPDKRSMGYPFDRQLPVENLPDLTSSYPNMITTNISIVFNNVVVDRPKS